MIKAIETVWPWPNGDKFRSRLEARWAVFFRSLGIKYKYELQGFDLGDELGWYLPDFYLPKLEMWIEIKPTIPTLEEVAKIIKVARETESHGFVLFGSPGLPELQISESGQWELLDGAAAFGTGKVMNWGGMPKDAWIDTALQTWRIDTGVEFWPLYIYEASPPPDDLVLESTSGESILPVKLLPDGTWYLCLCYGGGWMPRHYSGDGVTYDHPDLIAAYKTARQARFEHGESPKL